MTVSEWVQRYLTEGVEGLKVKPGRERKPAFSPMTKEEARAELEAVLRSSPRAYGIEHTQWRLKYLGQVLTAKRGFTRRSSS